MRIALLDSFYDTSHRQWAEGLRSHSKHDIDIYSSAGRHWKWKMIGGTLDLVAELEKSKINYDLFIVTDMINVPLFKSSLSSQYREIPIAMYFHENQISYPWSPEDEDVKLERDHHYGWINYISAVQSNALLFNSIYHQKSFFEALPQFIGMFPKFHKPQSLNELKSKSQVLPIGLSEISTQLGSSTKATFLWNHRWEYDKNPEAFFKSLIQLSESGYEFDLIVVGKSYKRYPEIFDNARTSLSKHILHWGWIDDAEAYNNLLSKTNILLVTSIQDFFGISIVEAIAKDCYPILPNRLAYPEHIPVELQDQVFYKNEDELMTLLKKVLDHKLYKQTERFSNYVAKYQWCQVINSYDMQFEKMM